MEIWMKRGVFFTFTWLVELTRSRLVTQFGCIASIWWGGQLMH